MAGLLTATGGFLLAVLWMDLIFDVQARRPIVEEKTDEGLDSITAYYRRAIVESQPMSKLIPAVMLVLVSALAVEAVFGDTPGWLLTLSSVLAGGPMVLTLTRTVPNAVRLGRDTGTPSGQSRLARSVLRDHTVCFAGMALFVALWVTRSLN